MQAYPGGSNATSADQQPPVSNQRRAALLIVLAVAVGLGLRLAQTLFSADIYDQRSYEIVIAIMRRGGNVYAETSRYNYSPVWAYLLLALDTLSGWIHTQPYLLIRSFLSVIDVGNAFLIGQIAEKVRPGSGRVAMVGYLLNPLAILTVGFDGQFETLATMPLLLATWLYLRDKKAGPTWLLVCAALLIKHIVIFSAWTLLVYVYKPRRAALLMIGALAVFVLSFAPYLPGGAEGIYRNVLGYTSLSGPYGMGMLLPTRLAAAIFFGVMFVLPLVAYYRLRLTLAEAMLLTAIGYLALIYGIGDQYFILVVLWAAIFPSRAYWFYTVVAVVTIPVPWNIIAQSVKESGLAVVFMLNAVWLTSAAWFISYFVRRRRTRPVRESTAPG